MMARSTGPLPGHTLCNALTRYRVPGGAQGNAQRCRACMHAFCPGPFRPHHLSA